MMNVAIIQIATGNYNELLRDSIKSLQTNFLKACKRNFFVFSDSSPTTFGKNIFHTKIEHQEWPYITLMRYKLINSIKELLDENNYTHIVYIDSDMICCSNITERDFPEPKEFSFFSVIHPFEKIMGPFENRKNSKAYVSDLERSNNIYHQGCLWGAKTPDFFQMNDTLMSWVDEDLSNDIIAIWHDESYLNRFLIDNSKMVYSFEESWAYPLQNVKRECKGAKFIHVNRKTFDPKTNTKI